MGILRFDAKGQIEAFEEKPQAERLRAIGQSYPSGSAPPGAAPDKPFVASMGVYVFSRDVLLSLLSSDDAKDFGREVIPSAVGRYRVHAYLFHDYWADVGTIESFYDANIMLTQPGAPFRFYDSHRPIYTHPRFLPGSRLDDCAVRHAIIAEGCYIDRATIEGSIVGIRTHILEGAVIRRSVLLGADYYEDDERAEHADVPRLGVGRDVQLDRVIVDKNARIGDGSRLVNAKGIREADGNGYFIRNGVIIVPKDAVIPNGFSV
jgi:glucose-1-phosphate adenylyltransferase